MHKLKLKKKKEKKLIGNKFRYYVDFVILICCFIIAINIHPSNIGYDSANTKDLDTSLEKNKMIYIFHDYEGNEFIMNDNIHGSASSWDYLFDDEVPNDLKGDDEENVESVSIGDLPEDSSTNNQIGNEEYNNSEGVKDNQVSIEDIMTDLGITDSEVDNEEVDNEEVDNEKTDETLIEDETSNNNINDVSLGIDVGDYDSEDNLYDDYIYVVMVTGANNSSLVIEKMSGNGDEYILGNNDTAVTYQDNDVNEKNIINNVDDGLLVAKYFTFVDEGWVLPTLVSWNDLFFEDSDQAVAYVDNSASNGGTNNGYNNTYNESKESGITIIEDYADCTTPWGYKIKHGESVLAYKQIDGAPNICNIERRFCWKGKLSGTYTQEGCSVNENYSYEQRGDTDTPIVKHGGDTVNSVSEQGENKNSSSSSKEKFIGKTKQNKDGTVSVKDSEIGGSFVFDRPNNIYTDFTGNEDNIRPEDSEVELSDRAYRDCTTPRGEKVKHGQFVQAFKHKNGFSDVPCKAQFRTCTMGDLMGTFTESSCKTWDTSFIDRVYGSPTRQTYSDEKLELVKKQIKADERQYNKDRKKIGKLDNDDDFDELLYILDENY